MKTLLIVDVQNDFLPGGSLEVPHSGPVIPAINSIQAHFDLVVASQDWHPKNHMSFASNHAGKRPFEKMFINGMEQTLWPDHCVQNTTGAELSPLLETAKIEGIFRKGMSPDIDSYSCFFDNGHKKSTGLNGYFKEKGVRDLYFCGLAADVCVYYSIMDALSAGLNCSLILDATYPIDEKNYESLKLKLKDKGVKLITSRDLV